jgi:hypothetical protein
MCQLWKEQTQDSAISYIAESTMPEVLVSIHIGLYQVYTSSEVWFYLRILEVISYILLLRDNRVGKHL